MEIIVKLCGKECGKISVGIQLKPTIIGLLGVDVRYNGTGGRT